MCGIVFSGIIGCQAAERDKSQEISDKERLQRGSAELFISSNISWFEIWRSKQLKVVDSMNENVQCALIRLAKNDDDFIDTVFVTEVRNKSPKPFTLDDGQLKGYRITWVKTTKNDTKSRSVIAPPQSINSEIDLIWRLVSSAEVNAQEDNFGVGRNEIWYVLGQRRQDKVGEIGTGVQFAKCYNPPKEGLVLRLWNVFLSKIKDEK